MKAPIIKTLTFLLIAFLFLSFDLPKGWFIAGSEPKSYDMGIAKGEGRDGKNCATIKSINKKIDGFGTLMQIIDPELYLGKRIRMSAFVKSVKVTDWAGLWLRVDELGTDNPLSFDNMGDRPIKGNTEWKKYEIVLDVPEKAYKLAFGALLGGTGQIWFDEIKFEIVDKTVPTTGGSITPKEPTNLNFDK